MSERADKGQAAEDLAVRYLQKRGLQVLARNYRKRRGELDIVAREGNTLCIVEVRSRNRSSPYLPEASLSSRKIQSLTRTTQALIQKYRLGHVPVRLDLLVVDWQTGDPELRFYPAGVRADAGR